MSVVIRLMRAGAKKRPFYRMVAADSRRQRDGRFLEILGHYNPLTKPYEIFVHKARVEAWIGKGAQPSEQAASLLRGLGISLQRQSAPKTNGAIAEAPKATPAKAAKPAVKAAAKRAPRKLSERKVAKKAARKAVKAKKA
ncbi:MAG: 30S ribosomal protein S16 [Candidatus Eisenbacteria bacterium]|uniref:Small ribosomal subunit protein bS16 n=1 Tax=Eiseniibacteriota bacterium TaxID=2212470 RepID=A0A9D6QPT2_UNCEI|nr:30S ribosomal protein S16 [Candidatus Eisenbacteria bacterium]MBI3540234.1 30S ribosomal protein S16 [Candidatus Eisenbacteria bacterium]